MITIENKTVYKCEYCRKTYLIGSACKKHEIACSKNPENSRACFDCDHCNETTTEVFLPMYGHPNNFEQRFLLHCDKLEVFLIPPKAEHRGNAYDTGDTPNLVMPKECEHQEFKF